MKYVILFISILFCSTFIYSNSYSKFRYKGKYGIIYEHRKVAVPPQYDMIKYYDGFSIVCIKHDFTVIYDKDLEFIHFFNEEKDMINKYSDTELLFGKKLLLNIDTHTYYSRKDIYQNEYGFNDGVQVVLLPEEHRKAKNIFSVMNKDNKIISPKCIQSGDKYSEGLLPVILLNGKSGYLNTNGRLVIKIPVYNDLRTAGIRISPNLNYPFHEGVAFLQTKRDNWVLLDKKGNIQKLPAGYSFPYRQFSNGLVVAENSEHKFGFMNKKLELIIPCIFDSAERFTGKYAIVVHNGKDAIIDDKGTIFYCEDICAEEN